MENEMDKQISDRHLQKETVDKTSIESYHQ